MPLPSGCGSSGAAGNPDASPGAMPDRAADSLEAGGAGLAGVVKDTAGAPVGNAKIEVGTASVFSDAQGKYALAAVTAGMVAVKVRRDWFKPLDEMVTIAGVTQHDITIEEMPLKIEPADRALAETYARTFDWTKQTLSIAIAARPTRRDFDNAVYFHNPALYHDTSAELPLTPSPQPAIAGGVATGFSFAVRTGPNQGMEALELASIVDSLPEAKLSVTESAEFMTWTPMVNWVTEWDPAKAANLKAVAVAVRQQTWGGPAQRPQEIDRVFLAGNPPALWAEVVFAGFVKLGGGVTDNDGDGRAEIYAKVAGVHYTADLLEKLAREYGKTMFNTHGLSKEVVKSLNELYSTTAAQVERLIGQPFEVPAVGTINYPFVVLRHSLGQKNVILVAPGP